MAEQEKVYPNMNKILTWCMCIILWSVKLSKQNIYLACGTASLQHATPTANPNNFTKNRTGLNVMFSMMLGSSCGGCTSNKTHCLLKLQDKHNLTQAEGVQQSFFPASLRTAILLLADWSSFPSPQGLLTVLISVLLTTAPQGHSTVANLHQAPARLGTHSPEGDSPRGFPSTWAGISSLLIPPAREEGQGSTRLRYRRPQRERGAFSPASPPQGPTLPHSTALHFSPSPQESGSSALLPRA